MRARFVTFDANDCVQSVGTFRATEETPPVGAYVVVLAAPTRIQDPDYVERVGNGDDELTFDRVVTPPVRIVPWSPVGNEIGVTEPTTLAELSQMMRQGDYLVTRPLSPQPTSAPGQIVVPPCPAGTRIEVFDMSGKEVMAVVIAETDDFSETFDFPDPGEYIVEVKAPAPARITKAKVVVT